MKKGFLVSGLLLFAMACSTAKLSSSGSGVEVVFQLDRKDCKNLGPVYGKGGGALGGAWIADQKLMEFATNDLRNKAAAKGATHVVAQAHQMGQTSGEYGGTTSTATQQGIAYSCPR